ncbi:MAG: GNAT family N-acetyltransferase [Lachnospiraceae bacterium]|nr:GNAT family N-acetyltransferase [Lachnospiraceae bacterium]
MDYLRKVTREDMDLLYDWANDLSVRANAFSTDPISYENHVAWFQARLEDPDTVMYIFIFDDRPVGQIRLDLEGGEAEIDYSIATPYRGKGYGQKMLALLEVVVQEFLPQIHTLTARVKLENQPSKHAFLKAGFLEDGLEEVKAQTCIRLIKHIAQWEKRDTQ